MRPLLKVTLLSVPLLAALTLGGCGGSGGARATGGSGASGGQPAGTGGGGGAAATSACLDQPNTLPTPPGGTLPCELIPPGVRL